MLDPVETVAPRLLGAIVTSEVGGARVSIRLTEVEAYAGEGEDPGSHAFRGRTPRNDTMFAPPGRIYVYFTYGMHWCSNIVTGAEGSASAVLMRAGEVIEGLDVARDRRRVGRAAPLGDRERRRVGQAAPLGDRDRRRTVRVDRDLARGPARLSAALGLTGDLDGIDLFDPDSPVRLALPRQPVPVHARTPRTGVSGPGAVIAWRFTADHPTVSPYRAATPRRADSS